MSGLIAVIPVIDEQLGVSCVESILMPGSAAGFERDELLVVDNTRARLAESLTLDGVRVHRDPDNHNIGCGRSWNIAIREVLDRGIDYVVLVSQSMFFGPELHTTWRAQMDRWWGAKVIEAESHSWHLIALHRSCFEAVGVFDPAYYPAYFEQTDFCYRLRMVGLEQGFVRASVNALSRGIAQGVNVSGVSCPAGPLLEHYRERWGGEKGHETFVQPYGDKPLDYHVEEPIPVLAERYGLGEYGIGWW